MCNTIYICMLKPSFCSVQAEVLLHMCLEAEHYTLMHAVRQCQHVQQRLCFTMLRIVLFRVGCVINIMCTGVLFRANV